MRLNSVFNFRSSGIISNSQDCFCGILAWGCACWILSDGLCIIPRAQKRARDDPSLPALKFFCYHTTCFEIVFCFNFFLLPLPL